MESREEEVMATTIIVRGMKIVIPEYVLFRGKRYEAISSAHSCFKDVVRGYAESDRRVGHQVIVKSFSTKERGTLVYVLYRHRRTKVYDQKTGKTRWEK